MNQELTNHEKDLVTQNQLLSLVSVYERIDMGNVEEVTGLELTDGTLQDYLATHLDVAVNGIWNAIHTLGAKGSIAFGFEKVGFEPDKEHALIHVSQPSESV